MTDGNRILQPQQERGAAAEIEIDIAAPDLSQDQTAGQQTSTGSYDFTQYHPTHLNEAIVKWLSGAATGNISGMRYGNEVDPRNYLGNAHLQNLFLNSAHLFTKLQGLHIIPDQDSASSGVICGQLSVADKVPFDAILSMVAHATQDQSYAQYYAQEFADALGVQDPKDLVDLTNASLTAYCPMVGPLKSLHGEYILPKNPYILLLAAEPEDRLAFSFFFDKVRENGYTALESGGVHTQVFGDTLDPNTPTYKMQCLSSLELHELTGEELIVPFLDILKVGKDEGITGLRPYVDKLKEFRDELAGTV